MSNKKGTKRQIIEIEDPGQEQNLGHRESGRARRSIATSPALTRKNRPSSSGLQPAATRSDGTGAIATRAKDGTDGTRAIANTTGGTMGSAEYARNATGGTDGTGATVRAADRTSGTGPIASRATDENIHSLAASGTKTSTGADPEDNDETRAPSEDNVSEMAAAGQTPSQDGPETRSFSTAALDRTRTKAATSPEANAGSQGRDRSADDVSMRTATGATTLTQSNSRGLSQAGTQDREVPRPDPATNPRWGALLRSMGVVPMGPGQPLEQPMGPTEPRNTLEMQPEEPMEQLKLALTKAGPG